MRILVTGGAGFIGSHVVDQLAEGPHEIVVLDNLDPQVHGDGEPRPRYLEKHLEQGRIEFVFGDLRDGSAVATSLAGVDTVVHLAAAVGVGQSMYTPHYYTSVNVAGQGQLMEEMAKDLGRFRRFVVASSMSIYGEGGYLCSAHGEVAAQPRTDARLSRGQWEAQCPICESEVAPGQTAEDKPLQFTSVYSISKKTQEELALCFGRAYDIPTIALRFFNVFGSRQALSNPYTGVAAIFLSRLKNGKAPLVFEDGRQSRDFIHVSDVARAVVESALGDQGVWNAYNVCTGRATSIQDVGEVLADRLGLPIGPEFVGRYRKGDIRHCVGNPELASKELGFEAMTSFETGMDELIKWSAKQEALDQVELSFTELERQGLVV